VEVATVTEETKPAKVATPVVLPNVSMPLYFLLPSLEGDLNNAPEFALLLPEADDPSPLVEANPEAAPIAAPVRKTVPKSAPRKTQLSDSRVAEIERAINSGTSRGKKGNSTVAVEESASGHLEGDLPVRINKPLEPILPAGESGRIANTTPKTNESNEGKSTPLPAEVELRAKTMGESAGKLSVGAAMEIDAPDKPAGSGRKGKKATDEQESISSGNSRPRRVKEKARPENVPTPKSIRQ
jgi:hypothetical protein